jgi:inhibitor of KinA
VTTEADLVTPRVQAFGDRGVIVDLGRSPGPETSRLVHDLVQHLIRQLGDEWSSDPDGEGWEMPVPAASSILVPVDAVQPGAALAVERVASIVAGWQPSSADTATEARDLIEIPVHYGGADGPDLLAVADLAGLRPEQVIELHSGRDYDVAFLGFAPGFAYLGPVAPELTLPRRREPRDRVPAGSVAIGGPQTAVYPGDGPGGWWLLGRTPTTIWDPDRDAPALLRPGTRVRFRPVLGS